MDPVRACPICPGCASKKFERLDSGGPAKKVRCRSCGRIVGI